MIRKIFREALFFAIVLVIGFAAVVMAVLSLFTPSGVEKVKKA